MQAQCNLSLRPPSPSATSTVAPSTRGRRLDSTRPRSRASASAPPSSKREAGERAVLVYVVGHGAEVAHVARVPDACREAMGIVRLGMNGAVFGVYSGPAAFGLERAVCRLEARLVEAVLERLRPDLDGLEQYVVLRIACHNPILSGVSPGSALRIAEPRCIRSPRLHPGRERPRAESSRNNARSSDRPTA